MRARPVSDAEYLRRYEREGRRYVARYAPGTGNSGPGAAYLRGGRWAWVDDGHQAAERWGRYASGYHGLKAMQPDGTWRPWDWRTLR